MNKTAESIRQNNIDKYKSQLDRNRFRCPNRITRNAKYNLRAYEEMTNTDILLSEKRAENLGLINYLTALDKFEERSRKSKHVFKSRIA